MSDNRKAEKVATLVRVVTERMPPYEYQKSRPQSARISFEVKAGPDQRDQERLREALQNFAVA